MIELLLAPHNDDESLFAAFTLQRRRPLVVVVTDSWVQAARGDGVSAEDRWRETVAALAILGCSGYRLGLRDDLLTLDGITAALARFTGVGGVWAPAMQHGHPHHDLVGQAAETVFGAQCPIGLYGTYSDREPAQAREGYAVDGSAAERARKQAALACYGSQHARSRRHFTAAAGPLEWVIR